MFGRLAPLLKKEIRTPQSQLASALGRSRQSGGGGGGGAGSSMSLASEDGGVGSSEDGVGSSEACTSLFRGGAIITFEGLRSQFEVVSPVSS